MYTAIATSKGQGMVVYFNTSMFLARSLLYTLHNHCGGSWL